MTSTSASESCRGCGPGDTIPRPWTRPSERFGSSVLASTELEAASEYSAKCKFRVGVVQPSATDSGDSGFITYSQTSGGETSSK